MRGQIIRPYSLYERVTEFSSRPKRQAGWAALSTDDVNRDSL